MRKTDYQKIDLYLNDELTGEELKDFNVELLLDSELTEEVEFHREVQKASQEQDIMKLREQLDCIAEEFKNSMKHSKEEVTSCHSDYNFGLSSEFSSMKDFSRPIGKGEINELSHSLPRMHLFQHGLAEKENIHQFYKEQLEETESEDTLLSAADEAMFAELRESLKEKDIHELRANLSQISEGMPSCRWNESEIDRYLNEDLSLESMSEIEKELTVNPELFRAVQIQKEIDNAIQEVDVIKLRTSLSDILGTSESVVSRSEEIEQYLSGELGEVESIAFEEDLTSNSILSSEVELYKDVDAALEESDVMSLRSKLEQIDDEIIKDRQRSIRMPLSRIAIASIAASLAVLLSIGGILTRHQSSDEDLYSKYYESYQTVGTPRSGNAMADNTLTEALQKFNAREYDSALELFQQVLSYDSKNPVGHFYSGVSYQETGRFSKAIDEYEVVVKDKDNLFVEQAEWYIGLCYLQTQDRKKAYRQMERIAKSDSYYNKKADAIVRKMKTVE